MVTSPSIQRSELLSQIRKALRRSRVVALLGPRQSGKTTLARQFLSPDSSGYFDLEDPASLRRLEEPMLALQDLKGVVVIDEIQRAPHLFPVLRVLADRTPVKARFLILGSASPNLVKGASESLAGRLESIPVSGFGLNEVGTANLHRLWMRGGFPRSFLARSETDSLAWRRDFINTILERDIPQLGIGISAPAMLRFWTMLAHWHGQIWNAAEPARSLGVSEATTRRYLDYLDGLFMVRQVQPFHGNLAKRVVKHPRIYLRDSGLLHQLLGVRTKAELEGNPKSGASWEGFAFEEVLRKTQPDQHYFWRTHNGAELDLLLIKGGKRTGVEFKFSDAPALTPSMLLALEDLELPKIWVVHAGSKRFLLHKSVEAVPLSELATGLNLF
jgi:predicted AAA+ superfamily ATPase